MLDKLVALAGHIASPIHPTIDSQPIDTNIVLFESYLGLCFKIWIWSFIVCGHLQAHQMPFLYHTSISLSEMLKTQAYKQTVCLFSLHVQHFHQDAGSRFENSFSRRSCWNRTLADIQASWMLILYNIGFDDSCVIRMCQSFSRTRHSRDGPEIRHNIP
jgi:hypothetical protein